jgi:polysaccharide biosynthesis/export protein
MRRIYIPFFFLLFTIIISGQNERNQQLNQMGVNTLSVTIGGDFIVTGSFAASINERVDQFITRTYTRARSELLSGATEPAEAYRIREETNNYSFRNISLIRANGERLTLDLLKFRRTGDFSHNPYLKNDDVLIFPPFDNLTNFISIHGAVNSPGKFPFVEGDRLTDLIDMANGINPAYEGIESAEIYRLSYDGEKANISTVAISSDPELRRGDRITIKAGEAQRRAFSVRVVGEVNNSGVIPITKSNTTLHEVINQAGGFTNSAAIRRGRVYTGNSINTLLERRFGVEVLEKERFWNDEMNNLLMNFERGMMYRMSNILIQDTTYFFLENELRVLNEGSAVDFTEVYDPNSEAGRYLVKDGDVIVIPRKTNTVYVYGQVVKPGHVNFVEGENYRYYIDKAGGLGELGRNEPMVIKGNTRNWVDPTKSNVTVEDGDYIWVPRDEPRDFNYYVWRFGNYVSILGGVATVILLLLTVGK